MSIGSDKFTEETTGVDTMDLYRYPQLKIKPARESLKRFVVSVHPGKILKVELDGSGRMARRD
ncbi:MAG: hypothetical protein ACOC86_02010 [Candidatus Bipolaricaulota bacterium]